MKLFGTRVKPIYLRIALPLFAVWIVALVWSANHHLGNQRYRLNYLAKGVRGVAHRNAAMIDPAELARIAGSAESGRVRFVLGEALKDLQYLPYFSEVYKERVMGRGSEEQVFEFRLEVQRRLPDGRFVQVGALTVPGDARDDAFGGPVALYAESAGALGQALTAWETGEAAEWITPENYQVFWPIKDSAATAGLLTLRVEREVHGTLYTVGFIGLLSFWFIGLAIVTAASSVVVAAIWIFNTLTIWGVGLLVAVVILLFRFRSVHSLGAGRRLHGRKNNHHPA